MSINNGYQSIDSSGFNLDIVYKNPPIYLINDFLDKISCQTLIASVGDNMIQAPVVGEGNGEISNARTSSTCYLHREDVPTVINNVSRLLRNKPISHIELPQVGQYLPTQEYEAHYDAFDLNSIHGLRFAQNGGQRLCTVLIYLNTVINGGRTIFPHLNLFFEPKEGT